ncbi:conserved hypothetical protein [Clostridium neonatale]|uniref:hypothetical protein n=1 Tax=Clostridium neonatale TaxID=137838 RepID=UPI001D4BF628|nr:hypothetical protein [Clostridium neonatale]CAG9713315.1 conserved hypothetical protein [Clostridium neonatale]
MNFTKNIKLNKNDINFRIVNIIMIITILCTMLFCICVYNDNQKIENISLSNVKYNEESIEYYIDNVRQSDNTIQIIGWVIKRGESIKRVDTNILLKDLETNEVFKINTRMNKRENLNEAFNDGNNYMYGGFFSKVFKRKLNSNHEYEILILYNNNDNNILINTNQTIKLK